MEIKHAEQKINNIEQAITKLTTIQEQQTKQTDRMIDSVGRFASMAILIEQNTLDIKHLGEKVERVTGNVYKKESAILSVVEENRKELDKIGQGRLWKGISIATGMLVFAFGYLYSDINRINGQHDNSIKHQQRVVSFMKYTEEKLDEIVEIKTKDNQ